MNHPLLSRRGLLIYLGIWVFIGVLQVFRLVHFASIPLDIALVDGFFSSVWFGVLGFSLWYYVCHSRRQHLTFLHTLGGYVFAGVVVLAIWVAGDYTIMSVIFRDNPIAISYLWQSIPWRMGGGVGLYALIILSYVMILGSADLKEKKLTEERLRESLKQSELNLLKSQINPHFLFNSLNSASMLTLTAPERAHEMIVALSEYLRYSISGSHEKYSPFHLELENSRRYLGIEKIRFEDKLIVDFVVASDCSACLVPSMILQPLYENAIKHGVYEATGQVKVVTVAKVQEAFLLVEISNTFEPNVSAKKGAGLGIANVRGRLQMLYGNDHSWLQVLPEDGQFTVKMTIPLRVT
jgi:sensor histidine kinase YesM